MRLLTHPSPAGDQPAPVHPPVVRARTGAAPGAAPKGRTRASHPAAPTVGESPVLADTPPPVDYTRPTDTVSLLLDLQQRVIRLEAWQTRKLTAGEFAIAVEATTGQSVEKLEKSGLVVEVCPCDSPRCKGWRLIPVDHHRTTGGMRTRNTGAVTVDELQDIAPPVPLDEEWDAEDLQAIFQQMFTEGLLTHGRNGATLIPPEGPASWTHTQMLAFAHGFELPDLLALEGKPRELQRQLIETLRGRGYTVLGQAQTALEASSTPQTGKTAGKKRKGS
jgi:hypothetical protein